MAAVPQPRAQAKVSVLRLISDLPVIKDVDDMLREGVDPVSVAMFIQQTMGLLTNVAQKTLANMLKERRENLPPLPEVSDPEEWPASTECDGDAPRSPGRLARLHYTKTARGIERMLEIESLYLFQRDRIDWLVGQEQSSGQVYEKMALEVASARELLRMHADLEREFGAAGNRFRMSVDISSKSNSELGRRVQKVLENPESRHKVVDLVKRLRAAGRLPEHVETVAEEP